MTTQLEEKQREAEVKQIEGVGKRARSRKRNREQREREERLTERHKTQWAIYDTKMQGKGGGSAPRGK